MDFEMKFLAAFYAVIAAAVTVGCVAILIQSALLGMLVVVAALIVGIGVLAVGLIEATPVDENRPTPPVA
jgi:hypothetical protein